MAVTEQGAVQELHIERDSSRGLVGNVYLGRVCRVLPGMQSAFVEIGLPRAAFLHVADIWAARNGGEAERPIEKHPLRGPDAARAGGEGPHRQQGRAAFHAGVHRGAAARVPAAGPAHRHLAAHRGRGRARAACARRCSRSSRRARPAASSCAPWPRPRTDAELNADIEYLVTLWKQIQLAAQTAAPQELLYQDLSLATRVLRDLVTDSTERIIVDSRETFAKVQDFAERYTRQALPILEHYSGERAALRPLRRRGRDREGARPARGPEERRLRDHRPDRGAHHHRREHRRLRLGPLLRRHDLQDQPRGGAVDRAPAAAAQPRRHHHRRLHRHGHARSTATPCWRSSARRSRATARASR